MNNVATRAAWTAPQALTVNQLFSSAWKDSNPCKYKTLSTAWPRWGEREGGMEGRVSNLTFDPTNKRHVSFRIAFQRGAPGAEWASFVILAVWGWLTGVRVGRAALLKTRRKTLPQLCHEKEDKRTMLIIDYLHLCTAVVMENPRNLVNFKDLKCFLFFFPEIKTFRMYNINLLIRCTEFIWGGSAGAEAPPLRDEWNHLCEQACTPTQTG